MTFKFNSEQVDEPRYLAHAWWILYHVQKPFGSNIEAGHNFTPVKPTFYLWILNWTKPKDFLRFLF